ncbi:MAG: NifB/NifX family molybdenum-iron cluster-binding protein [Chitinivibrionales bacterium]
MKIALPILEDRVATVVDFADILLVTHLHDGAVSGRLRIAFPRTLPSIRVATLRDLSVDTLICGAISDAFAAMVCHSGIELLPGITGPVDVILDAFAHGRLAGSRYSLPGAGPRGRCGWWRGRGRRYGRSMGRA